MPVALNYDHHDPLVRDWITKQISEFYFDNHLSKEKVKNVTNVSNCKGKLSIRKTNNNFRIFFQLFTDGWFLEAMDQYLDLRFAHKKRAPTYVYLFTHKASASFTEIFKGGRENYWGTCCVQTLKAASISKSNLFYFEFKV